MKTLAQAVLEYVRKRELLKAGDRVGVAVSGGADSVALLRLLLELRQELGVVLSVVHFNHKLRGAEADADEQFVAELAARYNFGFHHESGDVAAYAAKEHLSLETAAREMRYAYLPPPTRRGQTNRIATAHTLGRSGGNSIAARGAGRGNAGVGGNLSED